MATIKIPVQEIKTSKKFTIFEIRSTLHARSIDGTVAQRESRRPIYRLGLEIPLTRRSDGTFVTANGAITLAEI